MSMTADEALSWMLLRFSDRAMLPTANRVGDRAVKKLDHLFGSSKRTKNNRLRAGKAR